MSRNNGINIISQSPKFVQIPKGLSKIFKIMPKEDIELADVELQLYDDITYQGKYLNAFDLRTFLYLSSILSANRKKTQLFKSSDDLDIEKYSSDKHIVRVPILKWNPRSSISDLSRFFDLKVRPENINTVFKSLDRLTNSCIQTSTFRSKLISYTYDSLIFNPTFTSLFKTKFTNHTLTPKFYPLTTVKMDVVKQLSKSNINKLIIYYYLCDNVDFKQKVVFPIYQFSLLWFKGEYNRKTASFRRNFLKETLKEIQQLSQDFKIKIDNISITAIRIPDIGRNI
jgi:hypothetical protein